MPQEVVSVDVDRMSKNVSQLKLYAYRAGVVLESLAEFTASYELLPHRAFHHKVGCINLHNHPVDAVKFRPVPDLYMFHS